MKKYLLAIMIVGLAACSKSRKVLPEPEPSTHEKPIMVTDLGLKRGGIKELGSVSSWVSQNWNSLPSPRPPENTRRCDASVVAGTLCAKGTPICRTDDKLFSCKTATSRKVFGWVYEKLSHTEYKPFEGIQVDFYRFTQCLLTSGCEPLDTVYTDKWGYFEYIEQGAFKDTLSTKSPSGYFGYCSLGKMIHVNGSNFAYALPAGEKAFGAFSHQKIKEDSCK